MRLGILQPYFFPYLGYYQLANKVDHLVFLDDVSYIKNGWINRNKINTKNGMTWLTLRAKKNTLNLIRDSEVADLCFDIKKIRKTLLQNYSKAPNFSNGIEFFDRFIENVDGETSLSIIARKSITSVFEYLGTDIKTSSSSDLTVTSSAEQRVLDICRLLSATEYINPEGGIDLYNKSTFSSNNIDLRFLKKNPELNTHALEGWEDNASILDIIFYFNKEEIIGMLDNFYYV